MHRVSTNKKQITILEIDTTSSDIQLNKLRQHGTLSQTVSLLILNTFSIDESNRLPLVSIRQRRNIASQHIRHYRV